ncbi:MAG TPA: hypothetical protein VJ417_17390 [Candidatus Glassbacteria bacterium]|nr:hypothetical protein [Candidatus Glassbacteria bacterium]
MPKLTTRTKVLLGIVALSFCAGFLAKRYGGAAMKRWRYRRQKKKLADQIDRLKREVVRLEADLHKLEK